ncbi:aldo/keto reductase [Kitasatospora acidiphila]|uniref:Aldo/keto reductase n=1 Tax=Kitasatospora acidiphila TaxID=2567942 RepID=A0A540W0P9_9ACTN|nr:aldo/keto reductase [Kitasatospora acidiphila]TQF02596.1 aldo/keto reductase [Kitasatospora acidiphila]
MLKTRTLGRHGLAVSELGLGCMGMSQWYGATDDAESTATIHRALELGYTLFDTAEAYGPYDNEELLGRALAGRREQAVIATKFGFPMKLKDGSTAEADSRPEHITEVVEASLKRLGTDYIDVLYQHRLDPKVPIEEVVGAMGELVRQGKVRYLGLCEVGAKTIRRAHAVHPLSVVQAEFSVWERNLEDEVIPVLRELGIGLVGFCPLGRGFLTGGVKRAEEYPEDDFRHFDPRLQGANYDQNMAIAAKIKEVATRHDLTPAQLAIAWTLHQGDDVVPIPGTKRRTYLEENTRSAEVVLDSELLAEIEAAVRADAVAGPRYNERMMAFIDR